MLEVKNLVKTYKLTDKSKTKEVVALNDVSISFPETGLVFLLGKSGSGKSTLLNAIGGLDTFDSGEIIIKGRSSKSFTQSDFDSYRNTFIGFIFQEYNVLEEFTVAKNLALAIELQGKEASDEKVKELLQMVEMEGFAKRKPNQLSGGQKQRVAIARALIKNPEIIMADEPTGALDSRTGKQVMETLKKLSKEKLVIIVSHDREFAEIYGDRIVELKDGKIIQDVTKKEVVADKRASGISVIDNEIIHIKKGQKPTQEDMDLIFKQIMKNTEEGDTIISLSERANADMKKANAITDDGNKEVFVSTTAEDVKKKEYDPKQFKLIRSRLKYKDSFKMGASSLKHKVGKLVFTILLAFVAFTMFGVIDTLASFNRPEAVWSTVEKFDSKYVSLLKETPGSYGGNRKLPWTDKDLENMGEMFPDIEFIKVTGTQMYFGSEYASVEPRTLQHQNFLYSGSTLDTAYYTGATYVSEEDFSKLGLTLVAGEMPDAEREVAITKQQYDAYKKLNTSKITDYNSFLTSENNYVYLGYDWHKVVGIVDNGVSFSEYESLDEEQLEHDEAIQTQIMNKLISGFTCMTFVSKSDHEKMLERELNFQSMDIISKGKYIGSIEVSRTKNYVDKYTEGYLSKLEEANSMVVLKDGKVVTEAGSYNLKDGEIIISSRSFETLTEAQVHEKLNSDEPFIVSLNNKEWDYEQNEYVYTKVKDYKVVGYIKESWNYDILMNSNDAEYLQAMLSQYTNQLTYGDDYQNVYVNEYRTVDDYMSYRFNIQSQEEYIMGGEDGSSELGIAWLKEGKSVLSNGSIVDLGKNEILLPKERISQLGTEEEIQAMINEGLTIDLCYGDEENPDVWFTFTVVGYTSNWEAVYVSKETMTDVIEPRVSGFDYAMAILSDNAEENEKFIKYCEKFNDENVKFTVQNGATSMLDMFGEIIDTATTYIVWVGVGFAVFAALLLMNFISTSISHKKREIGILRALGARSSDVFGIFFNESFVIAMINFVLASVATFVASFIISDVIIKSLGIELVLLSPGIRQVLLIFGVSLLVAFLSSILPVSKIAKKKPIDAINNR